MGVTGLWMVVRPCARPIKLETLNKKRLAIDASIWIYQFLKAVRDKEGNALRNAHIVGFFRRICKLLYFGIKPVFVFDGGAPVLKRQTIAGRKKRREGRREDAVRTAGKLLAVHMQRRAEEEAAKRKEKRHDEEPEELPEELVYVDELQMTAKERQQNRQFRKKDAYHLPDLELSIEEMGAPDDPRIMSHEELEEYARQFQSGEDINLYDFSKIDFDGPFFLSLPASDRYNILNAARLRSRLRMGYSKDQLDTMFPDRMAFSKFQVERVKERNYLTQKLMNINGMNDESATHGVGFGSRIAGERGREYVLVKNSEVEGGWALGVLSNKDEGQRNQPIDVEQSENQILHDDDLQEGEDDYFEDIPIEGLNRLPKLTVIAKPLSDEKSLNEWSRELAAKKQALYESRRQMAGHQGYYGINIEPDDDQSLFFSNDLKRHDTDLRGLFEESEDEENRDDEDLHRAIQLSLEMSVDDGSHSDGPSNSRAQRIPSHSPSKDRGISDYSPDSCEDDMDLFAALAKSKAAARQSRSKPRSHPFDGPLPFESLNISKVSETRKPESQTPVDMEAGGFRREAVENDKHPVLPPWFVGDFQEKEFIHYEADDQFAGRDRYKQTVQQGDTLRTNKSIEVIDIDEELIRDKEAIGVETPSSEGHFTGTNLTISPVPITKVAKHPISLITIPTITATYTPTGGPISPPAIGEPVSYGEDNICESAATNEKHDLSETEDSTVAETATKTALTIQPVSPSPKFENVAHSNPVEIFDPQPDNDSFQAHTKYQGSATESNRDQDDYSDPEDHELMQQLTAEAEEHARFASMLNSKSHAENALEYEQELRQLRSQQRRDLRDADEISQIMITECQQLLKLFGLPYITAPMEAEAQCAKLVSLGLVDGIVTDDSDVFLFGGTRIYKNMFNQSKFVECYLAADLEKEYALDRKKLIRLAHLLGSDYTEGIPSVGPVTALEILTEFSTLEDFRDWWTQVQMGAMIAEDAHSAFRKKFKKNATKLFLPPAFPDPRVDIAYLEPEVDSDPSVFQWGVPDLDALREFLMATIGWTQERTDEVLIPVIRDVNRREQEGTQANITSFFDGGQGAGAFARRRRAEGMSRMDKAFNRLRNEAQVRRREQLPGTGDKDKDTSVGPGNKIEAMNSSYSSAKGPAWQAKTKRRTRVNDTPSLDSIAANKMTRKRQRRTVTRDG